MNAAAPGHDDKGVARRHLAPMILIIGCAFVETTAIYALLISIVLLFVV